MSDIHERVIAIGLTGGIASGKTAVSDRLRELGAQIIDTDQISRDLVAPGSECLAAIRMQFGDEFIRSDGQLDRSKMRQRISSDPASRHALEAILHPAIRSEALRRVSSSDPRAYCVVVVPLLVENLAAYDWLDGIIVVDTDRGRQVERVMKRDDVDADQARKMLDMQAAREVRLAAATWVIENNGSLDDLMACVDALHAQLKTWSASLPQSGPSTIKRELL